MKICLLSKDPQIECSRNLIETALSRGHSIETIEILRAMPGVLQVGGIGTDFSEQLSYPPQEYVLISRIGNYFPYFASSQARQLESLGMTALNPIASIERACNKLQSLELCQLAGLSVVPTIYVKDLDRVQEALACCASSQIVIKPIAGTQGRSVMLARDLVSAASILENSIYQNQEVLIQPFYSEGEGQDVRVLVLGAKVLGAIQRSASKGDFRSNFHQGGAIEAFELPADLKRKAVLASEALGLSFAGIDFIQGPKGFDILEINASPGWQGFQAATQIDVASLLVEYLENLAY